VRETQQLDHACVRQLTDRQLPEGGWSFTQDRKQPAIEPTALAVLALASSSLGERKAAIRFLVRTQNPNGSWPAFIGDDEDGCGFTGLVLYVLNRCCVQSIITDRAVHWLVQTRGWESHWLWRWKFRISDRHVRFDPDKFGWPWLPETVSWVVPTAYALLALRHIGENSAKGLPQLRMRRGVEMMYDRICPEGGWNAGNGVVYGAPLAPHPDATAIALLALLGEPRNGLITASLDWLKRRTDSCLSPWTLAWTILALDAFGHPTELLTNRLCTVVDPRAIADSATLAVVLLALRCARGSNVFRVTHEI